MNILAVAWDIDGTLVDSEPLHLESLQQVCAAHGVAIDDLPDEAFIGVHVHDVWATLAGRFPRDLTRERWLDALNGHFVDHARSVPVMPGAARTVAALDAAGVAQAAVSNSNRAVVDANLRAAGLARFMRTTVSLDDVTAGKPDPEPYLQALAALGTAAGSTMAVEDSETGLASANAAGLVTVGYGPAAASPLARFGITRLEALLDIVRAT